MCAACLRAVIRHVREPRVGVQHPDGPRDPGTGVAAEGRCRSAGADFTALFDDPPL